MWDNKRFTKVFNILHINSYSTKNIPKTTAGATVDSSKINFEKKAVLWVMVEWPNSYWLFHAGCMTEKPVD